MATETITSIPSDADVIVTVNPVHTILLPHDESSNVSIPVPSISPAAVQWMATILEEVDVENYNADNFIATIFEDLPVQEPKDYAEVNLEEYAECTCNACLGLPDDDDGQYLCLAGLCYDQSCWDCIRRGDYYSREVGFDLADEF